SGAHDASFRTNGSLAIFGDSNVGGTLTLNAATDITQTGGAFTAATLVANSANGNIALGISAHNVGATNLTTTGSHVATLSTSGALVITGASVGGGLTLSAAGNITQTGAITSAALDARSTGGDVTLANSGNAFGSLTTVTSSGHNASFVTGGALQVINANVGGTLSLAAGGNITQGTSINAGTLTVSSTGGSITLLNGGNNFGNLNVTTSGSFGASLFTGGSTVINSANVGGPFSLTAGNNITQTAAITTGALDVRSNGGDITLNNSGNVFSQLTVVTATGKNATLVKNGALLVVNANVGGTLSLTASGDITQGTSINAAALTLNSTGGNITLNNGGNNFANLNVTTGGSHTATLFTSGSTNVVSANVGGAFSLAAGNNITQSGAFSSGAFNVASTSGNITLNNSGNTFGTLTVTTPSGRFSNIAKSGSLVIGAASGGGSVTLSATGPVSQTGTIAAQNLTVSTTSGGINLGLATNAVTGFAAFNTPGALTFANSVVTFLGTSSIGGDTLILAQRDLVIQGGIQNNGTGNITLVSGWDGTTTDPTHFGDAGVYGNNSGSLFLNSGSVVGAKSGDLRVYANGVLLNTSSGYAQLGYHGAGGGNIFVKASGTVQVVGSSSDASNYAQIGNGAALGASSGNVTGNISVDASNLNVRGQLARGLIGNVAAAGSIASGNVTMRSVTGFVTADTLINDLGTTAQAGSGGDVYLLFHDNSGFGTYTVGGLAYDSPHNFTFATAGSAAATGRVRNAGTGAITLVAGWDGTTVGDAQTLRNANAYGLNHATFTIGGGSAFETVTVGSAGGTTTVLSNSVAVAAGNGFSAQLGYNGATNAGAITVVATGNVALTGASGLKAQIGSGATLASGASTQDVSLSVGGSLTGNSDAYIAAKALSIAMASGTATIGSVGSPLLIGANSLAISSVPGTASVDTIISATGPLSLAGINTGTGLFNLTASGAISQTAALHTGGLRVTTSSGAIVLT
ncbi:MAG: hypothetical protein JO346_10755, partial [Alphaproteobacteria bacterium]|nr:hypothetical protein [Alphaproteobacteria bacterium]